MGKTKFQLATGPLSYLKEVTIDLELKARHYDDLVAADENSYERAVLAALKDLMDEDPFQLTMQELYHLWLYVKVKSLGSKITTNVRCKHIVHDKQGERECGYLNTAEYSLVDSDIVYPPKNFVIPEITFITGGKEQIFEVRPPTMVQELDLFAYFQEKGISKEVLLKEKLNVLEYAKHRILIHLKNKETGDRFFDRTQRESALKDIADNPLSFLKLAGEKMELVNSFGVSHQRMTLVCKECGGKLTFRLPLQAGLSM
jgi:hypothetical protein